MDHMILLCCAGNLKKKHSIGMLLMLYLSIGLCEDFQKLKLSLQVFKSTAVTDEDNLFKVIQDAIQSTVETAVLKCIDVQSIRDQMHYLCHTSFDVPARLTDWAKEQVEQVYQKSGKKSEDPKPCVPPTLNITPLFNKDTLYHASLCSQAVGNSIHRAQYKKFLDAKGHNLKEVSMSRSLDRNNVIIAKQDNIVYIAFESEPSLSGWSKYASFDEGIILSTINKFQIAHLHVILWHACTHSHACIVS